MKYFKLKNNYNKINKQSGMSYTELIVVLSIFAIMSSVVSYNYIDFQAKVDLKSLASDIAGIITKAQQEAIAGDFPPTAQQSLISANWKPSYGVYFSSLPALDANKKFIYFTDIDLDNFLDNIDCSVTGECLEKITMPNKTNYISQIALCADAACTTSLPQYSTVNTLAITFKRPNTAAVFKEIETGPVLTVLSHVQITIQFPPPKVITAKIKIYPSGRIQVN